MFDLDAYPDSAVLSTSEVARWLGFSVKSVLRMGLPLANLKARQAHYLARDVKAHVAPRAIGAMRQLKKAS